MIVGKTERRILGKQEEKGGIREKDDAM